MQSTIQKSKATLPNPLPDTDEVVERHLGLLAKTEGMLQFKKNKYAEASNKVVDHRGSVRPGFARESSLRYEEIVALERRCGELKDKLKEAEKDLPRRERIRKRMKDISEKHAAAEKSIRRKEKEIASLKEELGSLSRVHDTLSIRAANAPWELKNRGFFNFDEDPEL